MDMIADLNKLKKCKKKAEDKNDLKELAKICNALGELLSQYGRHKEAIPEHEMEKQASEAMQDKIGEAVACRKLGECYCKLGHFDKALKLQNRYLALAEECGDKVETQRALATLGNTYYSQAEQGSESSHRLLDQAERKYLQALRACEDLRGSSSLTESEHMAMKGRLLLNLGLVYDERGAEKESTEYFQKALTIARQWHLEEEQYLCHFNTASQALRRGHAASARQSLQQALTIATHLHHKPREKEVYCQLAIASVSAGNIKESKHFLKKAYKLLPTPEESTKLIKLFKAVSTVEELTEQSSASNPDDSQLFGIHEKLGDAFTDIGAYCGSYAPAIKHYQQMVECGERLALGAEKLIPAYVSLAQTYADNRQPELAISSYHKELQLRDNDHEQICRTWLNIAEQEEKKGDSYKALSKSYVSAFSHAKKADHSRLQVQVLRSLMAVQAVFKEHRHREQTEAKLRQVQTKYGLQPDDSLSEEEEDSQPPDSNAQAGVDHDTDLSISDLTDSDKSDEENVHPDLTESVSITRTRRRKTFKKNEKGETPLHLACMRGDLKRVKALVAEGHPVNVRDNCGWTPLHEAANFDHVAVVEVLLDAGADANDRGGADCNGFTPLIDAAACGNTDVMKLLIQRGANVLAKDDRGCTALQMLRNWCRDSEDTVDEESLADARSVLLLLEERMSSVSGGKGQGSSAGPSTGITSSTSPTHQPGPHSASRSASSGTQHAARSLHSHNSQSVSSKRRPLNTASSDEEEELYHNPQLEDITASPQSATEAYRTSILALGSSTQRAMARTTVTRPPSSQASHQTVKPALIDEQEMVGDDWLIDDMQLSGRKRRDCSSLNSFLSSDSVRQAKRQKKARLSTKHRRSESNSDSDDGLRTMEAVRLSQENSKRKSKVSPGLTHTDLSDISHVVGSGVDSDSEEENALPVLSHTVRRVESYEQAESQDSLADSVYSNTGDTTTREVEPRRLSALSHTVRRVECYEQAESQDTLADSVYSNTGDTTTREVEPRRLSDGRTEQEGPADEHHQFGSTQRRDGPLPNSMPARLTRVKVKIEGSVFLIPIPAAEDKTVKWLSEEASQRYGSHCGQRPLLTLTTSDGAILCTDDVLSAVLSHEEQLDGTVHGWDQPALSERYTQACKTLNTVKYRNIYGILKEAEASHKVSLSGLGLRSTIFLPIVRALRGQTVLQQLHLPDNHLGDNGVEGLVTALADLKGLTHLNLAGNAITATGLKHLAGLFSSGAHRNNAPPLQVLSTLDVSHNPLGSSIADSLCSIVRGLPALTSLLLSSCCLSATLFQHNRPTLAASLQESSLQQLDVSHNNLGTLGVELLLRSINIQKLTSLDLGHTCSDSSPGHLALHFKIFLSQGCALQHLSLESCCLHREDVEFLCRLPNELPGLKKVNISLNKAVTTDCVRRLFLSSAQQAHSQLQHLEAESCSLTSPLSLPHSSTSDSSFLQSLRAKLSCVHPLHHLSLTCVGLDKVDRDSLSEAWSNRWTQSTVQFSGQSVLLTVKQLD